MKQHDVQSPNEPRLSEALSCKYLIVIVVRLGTVYTNAGREDCGGGGKCPGSTGLKVEDKISPFGSKPGTVESEWRRVRNV